jgi:hypothetical protein
MSQAPRNARMMLKPQQLVTRVTALRIPDIIPQGDAFSFY